MEEQPAKSPSYGSRLIGFIRRLGVILGIVCIFVLVYCLVNGRWRGDTASNGFFIAAFVLFATASWPILGEVASSMTLANRAVNGQEEYRRAMQAAQEKRERGASTTYLYGTAGIAALGLAALALLLFH